MDGNVDLLTGAAGATAGAATGPASSSSSPNRVEKRTTGICSLSGIRAGRWVSDVGLNVKQKFGK